jgi:hypothetical protein
MLNCSSNFKSSIISLILDKGIWFGEIYMGFLFIYLLVCYDQFMGPHD